VLAPPLHHHEQQQQYRRGREAAEHQAVGEGPLVGLDQRIHQARQGQGEEHETRPVGAPGVRRAGLADLGHGDDHGRHPDGQVDEEDPAPGQAGGQNAAQQRPDSHGQSGDRAPDPEGDAAILAPERLGQQRQRHSEHDRPADALQRPGELEHESAARQAAHQRRGGEYDQADDVEQAPSVHVGQAAGRQQEGGQAQRVGVHDPLQAGEARVQRTLDVRQRDVHDRDVQQQHEGAEAYGDQRPPLVTCLSRLTAAAAAAVVPFVAPVLAVLGQPGVGAAHRGPR